MNHVMGRWNETRFQYDPPDQGVETEKIGQFWPILGGTPPDPPLGGGPGAPGGGPGEGGVPGRGGARGRPLAGGASLAPGGLREGRKRANGRRSEGGKKSDEKIPYIFILLRV